MVGGGQKDGRKKEALVKGKMSGRCDEGEMMGLGSRDGGV